MRKTEKKNKINTWIAWAGGITIIGAASFVAGWFLIPLIFNTDKNGVLNENKGDITNVVRGEALVLDKSNDVPIKLIEYKHNNKYFLGKDGLDLLNKQIKERLPFGPEVRSLKMININNTFALPRSPFEVNGQYNTITSELDLDARNLIDSFSFLPLKDRVEYLFSIILHEYGHHLSNTYITSTNLNSQYNYNKNQNSSLTLKYSDRDGDTFYKNVPKAFLEKWLSALNYNNPEFNSIYSKEGVSFYNAWSSNELFSAANHWNYSQDLKEKVNDVNLNKTWNTQFVSPNYPTMSSYGINIKNLIDYNFSFDELVTRHLVALNYIPSPEVVRGNTVSGYPSLPSDRFYSIGFKSRLLNSSAIDILSRNNISIENNQYIDNPYIQASDNIFGGTIINQNNERKKFESNAQSLTQAYNEVFGFGKIISQIFIDQPGSFYEEKQVNNKKFWVRSPFESNNFDKVKIGGYIPESKKDQFKGIILNDKDNLNTIIPIDYMSKSNSTKAKSSVLGNAYVTNGFGTYYQYTTQAIDFGQYPINSLSSIGYWMDENNNNKLEASEMKKISKNDVAQNRDISTFREAYRVYGTNGITYSYADTRNINIYELVFKNDELVFRNYKN